MKKTVAAAGITAALTLGAGPALSASVPESDDPIKIMVGDWTSIGLQAEIIALILQTMGYDTEMVVAEDSARYPGFEAGDIHISMETWQSTQAQNLAKSLATGKTVDLGETGLQGKEDWWYPLYVKDKCPGLPQWEALRDCAELFSTADTAPLGRYVGGVVSWGGFDEERIEALDLPFQVIHPGTDAAMFAELKSAYEREEPIIMWVWIPHWAPALYEGEFVEFPAYTDACYNDPSWGVNPEAKYDCGKPSGWIKKMGWAEGEKVWPCAYEIVRNYKMDNATISKLIAEVDLEGRPSEEVALEWVKDNQDTWRPWTACAEG